MNICEWTKVPEPKSDEDPIPVTGGHVYDGKDKNGSRLLSAMYHTYENGLGNEKLFKTVDVLSEKC